MSAVEIGNPKMDAGVASSNSQAAAAAEAAKASASTQCAPTDVSGAQLLSVMDHLMHLEASWMTGNSIRQTLYSCAYMTALQR